MFNGAATTVTGLSDVVLNNPATNQYFGYNGATSKWNNMSLVGKVALATSGGSETVATANATGTSTLNLANANVFDITLTGNTTFTFTGATAGRACSFGLYLRQDGTGNRTVNWPASVKWSGADPVLTTIASSIDVLVFESIDGGTTWFGSLVGTNFA